LSNNQKDCINNQNGLLFSTRSILPTTDKTVIFMSLIVKIGEKSKQDIPKFRAGKPYSWTGKKM
jgi:hypothetical protein